MKVMWFLPFTFVAGVHGFAFFAPYLAVFMTATHIAKRFKRAN